MARSSREFQGRRKLLDPVRLALAALVLATLPVAADVPDGYKCLGCNSGVLQAGGPVYLTGCLGISRAAGTVYIQFFNSNTVPTAGTAPAMTAIKVAAATQFAWDAGGSTARVFNTGVSWAESSTDNTYTAVAGTDIDISCQYNPKGF